MNFEDIKKQIKELIDILKGTDVSEIEIERQGLRLKITRQQQKEIVKTVEEVPVPGSNISEPSVEETTGLHAIKAPLVGTFYRAPSPDSEPFVEVGTKVKKGDVLCIIEAMKLMNEIESDVDGEIEKILVENGQPVEYGQILFLIKPER